MTWKPTTPQRRALEGVPVLVVEDHPASARMLVALLASAGAEVKTAATAEAAVDLVDAFAPRVVVVDIVLPGASGLTLVSTLKGNARTQGIICIAITVINGRALAQAASDAGCDAYVRKPLDTDAFASLIAQHLEGKP